MRRSRYNSVIRWAEFNGSLVCPNNLSADQIITQKTHLLGKAVNTVAAAARLSKSFKP
jgi:hypothetical protein